MLEGLQVAVADTYAICETIDSGQKTSQIQVEVKTALATTTPVGSVGELRSCPGPGNLRPRRRIEAMTCVELCQFCLEEMVKTETGWNAAFRSSFLAQRVSAC